MNSKPADAFTEGSEWAYGLEVVEVGEDRARGRVAVREECKQPLGAVHSGVYAAIADALTSLATARAVGPERKVAAPISSQTSYLRPITEGTIAAAALAKHRGRTTWVWEVEMCDDQGRLCVLTRTTVALEAA